MGVNDVFVKASDVLNVNEVIGMYRRLCTDGYESGLPQRHEMRCRKSGFFNRAICDSTFV